MATRARLGLRVPVLLDSRYQLDRFRGLTACTPNESEVEHVLGVTIGDDPEALEKAGRTLLRRTRMTAVLVTRGSRGMALFERGKPTRHLPIFGSDEIADVTGAGDTVIATVTLALASGASFVEAARHRQLRGRPGGDETGHGDGQLPTSSATPSGTTWDSDGRGRLDRSAGRARRSRASGGATGRVRQRLLRSPARGPREVPAGSGSRRRRPRRGDQRRRVGEGPQGRRADR